MRVAQAETAGKNSFFLPRASFFNDVIEMDTFHLKWDDVKCKILAIIDVYSRFETNAIIQSETIEEELDIMQKQWISWAGFPKVIKTDSSEAHMSEYLQAWCDDKGIKLLLVPKETHHQLGLVERLHAVRRQQLYKMKNERFDLKLETAGLHACDQRNGLRSVHRVSAVSIVFGYTPAQARISDEPHAGRPDGHPRKLENAEIRILAAKPFYAANHSNTIRRTLLAKSRKEHEPLQVNWVDNSAWRAMDDHETGAGEVVPTRFLQRRKATPEGEKTNARVIIQGFKQKDVLEKELETDSPTLSRVGRMLIYVMAVHQSWKVFSANVRSAFMQADSIDESTRIYVKPTAEMRRRL